MGEKYFKRNLLQESISLLLAVPALFLLLVTFAAYMSAWTVVYFIKWKYRIINKYLGISKLFTRLKASTHQFSTKFLP